MADYHPLIARAIAEADGKLIVEKLDPAPDSDAEDAALLDFAFAPTATELKQLENLGRIGLDHYCPVIAAAAPATNAIPIVPASKGVSAGRPGTANNMPMTAQNTISDTTRGLVS